MQNDLTTIENDLVNKLAAKLSIKQWYSLYLIDVCEGTFSPNASTPSAGYNVSSCTNTTAMCKPPPPYSTFESLDIKLTTNQISSILQAPLTMNSKLVRST
jgi:hypothetical protein